MLLQNPRMPDTQNQSREDGRNLYSVAQIQHVLRVEFGRAQRYRYPIMCLVIAIDQLGSLRDAHGYEAKETVFDAVVELLERATRSSDFLGRTADDRLLAIIPHTGLDGARLLAARLLGEAKALEWDGALDGTKITLSIGAASNDHEGLVYHDALMTAAEVALATASADGGDRFVEGRP